MLKYIYQCHSPAVTTSDINTFLEKSVAVTVHTKSAFLYNKRLVMLNTATIIGRKNTFKRYWDGNFYDLLLGPFQNVFIFSVNRILSKRIC